MPKIRLRAPRGTDEANSSMSSVPYKVGLDGTVEVDEEAVAPLLARGGFTLADVRQEPVPDGLVRMAHHSDPHASCSFDGVAYAPGPDGFLLVPAGAVEALTAHGFVSVVSVEPEAVAAAEEPAAPSPPAPAASEAPAEVAGSEAPAASKPGKGGSAA
jgi:hypothetical protein